MSDQEEFEYLVKAEDFFHRPKVLVIDDIGTETFPLVRFGSTYNLVEKALDMRYRAFSATGVRTIITTNFSDEDLRQRYGYRIDDRLSEMFDFATVKGRSLRG